ncbi:MAG: Hsp70 family protein [Thermoguttaceae bacterium]|nr:Hsp70 family protein [Thermoguttaceae bacterium]
MAIIIGLDLGDGDTLASKLNANQKAIEMDMPGGRAPGHPVSSFYARANNGTVTIGNNALLQSNAQELMVNFKKRPSKLTEDEREKMRNDVKTFTDAIFLDNNFMQSIGGKNSIADNEIVINIGYPTKWNREDAGYYLEMLQSCSFLQEYKAKGKSVKIDLKKESRAAILNMRYDNKNGQDILTKVPSGQFIVVFDFGSSTTDVTVVSKTEKYSVQSADYGDPNLGARLIDRGIYQEILSLLPEDKKRTLKADPNLENQAIGKCREAKEIYFNTPDSENQTDDYWYSVTKATRTFPLPDYFTSNIIQKALAHRWPELNNRTYQEACKAHFEEVVRKLQEQKLQPALIILTGGASRMPFVKEYCEQAFTTQFNHPQISLDDNPSSSIAKGLAYTELADEKAKAFQAEIDKLCKGIPQIIENKIPQLSKKIGEGTAGPLLGIIKREVYAWRNGSYDTLQNMENGIEGKIENYLKSDAMQNSMKGIIHSWLLDHVIPEIDRKTRAIALQYSIKYDSNYLTNIFKNIKIDNPTFSVNPDMDGLERQVHAVLCDTILKIIPAVMMILIVVLGPIILNVVGIIVGLIVGALSLIIFGLLGLNPVIGWPIIAAICGVALWQIVRHGWSAFRERFIENVKTHNILQMFRNGVTNNNIDECVNQKVYETQAAIKDGLNNDKNYMKKITESFSGGFQELVRNLATQISLDLY